MANDNEIMFELSVPKDYGTLAAWHNVGDAIATRLSGSNIEHNFLSVFRKTTETFGDQLQYKKQDFGTRNPDGKSTSHLQGRTFDTILLERFEPWDAITESILKRFEQEVWDAICQAVDQHLTDYKDTAIYRQTTKHLDAKLKGQMKTVREHVEQFLRLVHSTPSCYAPTWAKRLQEQVTTLKRDHAETCIDGRATPRSTKRFRKQGSTLTKSVIEQTPVRDEFLQFAARLSTAYQYEVDQHVNNVAKTLHFEVISHLEKENVQNLYKIASSSTIKNG